MASNSICTTCGWLAAIISCVSFGSFAVPIKSKAAQSCNVDPLVFQSYKTIMCLITSFLTLTPGILEQKFYFTPYGIISGIFWVPAGIAAVYAVQHAGLALSQGLWSSVIVLVSFTWGIFVFEEGVKSKSVASFAVLVMCVGLWGMSYFSSPTIAITMACGSGNERHANADDAGVDDDANYDDDGFNLQLHRHNYRNVYPCSAEDEDFLGRNVADSTGIKTETDSNEEEVRNAHNGLVSSADIDIDMDLDLDLDMDSPPRYEHSKSQYEMIRRRRRGMAAAVFNGVWGGSIMVPMHYAPPEASGMGYVVSFAIGASIVTLVLWILRFGYVWYRQPVSVPMSTSMHTSISMPQQRSIRRAFRDLPPFHFRVMWAPGCLAGTLWSIGNVASMVSVHNLGEGVGYSVTQASMLCSGLWGIFYFNEVVSWSMRIKWFVSAIITVGGILLLSDEHQEEGS